MEDRDRYEELSIKGVPTGMHAPSPYHPPVG